MVLRNDWPGSREGVLEAIGTDWMWSVNTESGITNLYLEEASTSLDIHNVLES